jgi:hypothetical protein
MPKTRWLACLVVVALSTRMASAQAPNKLEEILKDWEKATASLKNVTSAVSRTTISKTFQTVERYDGDVKLLRSNVPDRGLLARLTLAKKGKPEDLVQALWTDSDVCLWDPPNKTIRVFKWPAPKRRPKRPMRKQ